MKEKSYKEQHYLDGETPVTSPLYLTKCQCGNTFYRLMKHQTVTCSRCKRVFRTE